MIAPGVAIVHIMEDVAGWRSNNFARRPDNAAHALDERAPSVSQHIVG